MIQRLSESILGDLKGVSPPSYARSSLVPGLVHIGVGGFHRAHQASYSERVLSSGDLRWGCIGASLRSDHTYNRLRAQDFLYTLATRSHDDETLSIHGGLIDMVLDASSLAKALANPKVQVVTLTITEKGYANGEAVPTLLARAIEQRMETDAPLTLLSCDNLVQNGKVLRECVAANCTPNVRGWMRDHVSFPSSMVDRITPQTEEADLKQLEVSHGYRDEALVVCEPFSQWVIEDQFRGERPEWELGGAQFVADVLPYEQAKLRLLNASHSIFALMGLLRGYEFVHEAVADTELHEFVLDTLSKEIIPNVEVPKDLNAERYVDSIIRRFANSSMPYRTSQVASDSSVKLPQRVYPTIESIWVRGAAAPRLELVLCAWIKTLFGRSDKGDAIAYVDPGVETIREGIRSAALAPVQYVANKDKHWASFPEHAIERMDSAYGALHSGLSAAIRQLADRYISA